MLRLVFIIGAIFIFEPRAVFGQEYPWLNVNQLQDSTLSEHDRIMRHVLIRSLTPMPAESNPFVTDIRQFLAGDEEDLGFPGDTLTEHQILQRMARIYGYQSKMLEARAREDYKTVENLLDRSVGALSILLDQPEWAGQPQARELYRTVVVEYERYYGFSDSLTMQRGDIYAARDNAFRTIDASDQAPLDGMSLPELEFADTEVPMPVNERVKSSIVFLLTEPDKHINNWLSRAETYFPMVEKIFAEEGIPDELKYLGMIESGLNPKARSWARAVGMWQFVRATGRAYDLNSNGWVDERMNPEKATRAAAKHLKDLYRMFGDWHLALAGYNYSPGKLRRHLRRARATLGREANFWDVYNRLPRETRNYVPMFIATAIVASNPTKFNLGKDIVPGPAYEFDYVPVQGMLSLKEVADMAGTDLETIKALNPEIRSNHLPPTRSAYYVRIPLHTYDRFAEHYSQLPSAQKRAATHHRVRRGETLGQIARRYGVSVSSLMRKNGLHSSMIRVGQNLVVPITNYSGGIEMTDAHPLRVRYGIGFTRPIAPTTTSPLDASLLIARADERREELNPRIEAKQVSEKVRKTSSGETAQSQSSQEDKPATTRVVYRVRRGDTLIKIANRFSVTVSQIRKWNNIKNSMIRIGQRLTIYLEPSS